MTTKTDDTKAQELVDAFKPLADAAGKLKHGHTPGPWRVVEQHGSKENFYQFFIEPNVASVFLPSSKGGDVNARLIAAAPELLVALKGLLNWPAPFTESAIEEQQEKKRAALAAIAKAEGKAS